MVEAAALAAKTVEAGAVPDVIENDRAYGSAPELSRDVALRLREFAEGRGL